MEELDIDICLIQETKLSSKSRNPVFKGYGAIRADRNVTSGGGLLSLIRNTLIFEEIHKGAKNATEVSTFRVRMARGKWITISNVYAPPHNSKGQDITQLVAVDIIPTLKNSLICGDVNAHSPLWDEIQPPDARGNQIVDWVIDKDLSILNTGEPTRVSYITGNKSTPDITLCGRKWKGKCEWAPTEARFVRPLPHHHLREQPNETPTDHGGTCQMEEPGG